MLEGNPRAGGIPLVFLHGILGSIDFWPPLIPTAIRESRRWISLGLPGHFPGRLAAASAGAPFPESDFTGLLAQAVREAAGGGPAGLVGYSTGGFAALAIAARYPELTAGVLSIAGFSCGRWHGLLRRMQSLAARGRLGRRLFVGGYRAMVGSRPIFRRTLLWHAARPIDIHSQTIDRLVEAAAADARRQDAAAMAHLMASIRDYDIGKQLAKITAPVVIAAGDRDPVIPFRQAEALARAIPGAELVPLAGTGHLFQLECADSFQTLLEGWANRCLPRLATCAA